LDPEIEENNYLKFKNKDSFLEYIPPLFLCCQLIMADKELIKLEGIISEALPSTTFKVKLENGHEVLAHISGRMRVNYIRLLPGDRVLLEMSPYDLTKGRITKRL